MNRISIILLCAGSLLLASCAGPELGLCDEATDRLTLPVLM